MSPETSDFPLSIFRDALASVVGRLLSFVLAASLGCGFTVLVQALIRRGPSQVLGDFSLLGLLGLPLFWGGALLLSICQVWGLLTVVILGWIFVYHFFEEAEPSLTLPLVFLVQALDTLRAMVQEKGWQRCLEPWAIGTLLAWLVLCVLYTRYVIRLRYGSTTEGPPP